MNTLRCVLSGALALLAGACSTAPQTTSEAPRVLFFGDSITELGVRPRGYVALVGDSLRQDTATRRWQVLGAGISGHRVPDLLARLDRDVLAKTPSLVVIYIGINDVWHWALLNRGTPKPEYEAGLREIIGRIKAAGATVILCTPSVIGENTASATPQDVMLDEYAAVSRTVARETGTQLCDLRSAFVGYLREHNPDNRERGILTTDGVHLNDAGNQFVARHMLTALKESMLFTSR